MWYDEIVDPDEKAKQIKEIKSQNEGIEQSGKIELNEKIDILLND